MEPIRAEPLHLKHPTPQDDGDDECDTPSMYPPDNLPDNINITPLPTIVKTNQWPLSQQVTAYLCPKIPMLMPMPIIAPSQSILTIPINPVLLLI